MSYWVDFEGRASACINVFSEAEALKVAAELGGGAKPIRARQLPYTADPQLGKRWEAWCYSPLECVGRSSCPKRRACSE